MGKLDRLETNFVINFGTFVQERGLMAPKYSTMTKDVMMKNGSSNFKSAGKIDCFKSINTNKTV